MLNVTHTIRRTLARAALAGLLVATGCPEDTDPNNPPPTQGNKDASVSADTGVTPTTDAGFPDSGAHADATVLPPPDDGNDTPGEADPIMFGTANRVDGTINPALDVDWYSFNGTAGDWISIFTSANPRSDPMLVDTVVQLYAAADTTNPIAQNDDAFPRASPDSELMTRLPTTGQYYVKVIEFSEWAGRTPEGAATYRYSLAVLKLTPATNPYITEDAEAGDGEAGAPALGFLASTSSGILVGSFRDADDIDAFKFTIEGDETVNFSAQVMPGGAEQNGTTNNPGRMWIANVGGSTVTAAVNYNDGLTSIGPPTAPGDYVLFLEHAKTASGAGANDFYVLKYRYGQENTLLNPEPDNNSRATAPELELTDSGDLRSGFLYTRIGDGDVDYFRFDLRQAEVVSVACGARSSGSGLVDLTAVVEDGTGASLQTGTETSTTPVFYENVTTTSSGAHYLKLSKGSQSAMVQGDWVRCGVRASVQ